MKTFSILMVMLSLLFLQSCSKELVGGAAVGAGAAGAAYEYQNKQAMDALKDDYKAGRITQEEYNRRKKEIENKSLVY